jgi:glycosyltransferase involved in cell wall biosynthesis
VTVALITAGPLDRPGGSGLRWRALAQAIDGCRHYELSCDRWSHCAVRCAATGQSHPAGSRPGPFYDRTFCVPFVDDLMQRLAADGIRTVVCSGLDTYRYVNQLALAPDLRVIFDLHNVEFPLQSAIMAAAPPGPPYVPDDVPGHLRRVGEAEHMACTAAAEVWTCSDDDRRLLIETYPDVDAGAVRVAPNSVEVPDRPPLQNDPPARICYPGRLDWYPNLVAARLLIDHIAPRLSALNCPLPVVIAGAQADWLAGPGLPPNVRLVNDPDATGDLIAGSLMLVPLTLGGGTRLKILEAFALGTPVVSTAKGVEGLAVEPGVHYLAAEHPDEFADRTVELCGDAALRHRLATAAWELTRERYSFTRLRSLLGAVGQR